MTARAPIAMLPGRNKLEQAYAQHLEIEKAAEAIAAWWYEPMRMRIGTSAEGRDSFYTPDFMVQLPDETLQLHEVKGRWMEAARVRIRAAAMVYPFTFLAITQDRHGWHYERF